MKLFFVFANVFIIKNIIAIDYYSTQTPDFLELSTTSDAIEDYIIDESNNSTKSYDDYYDEKSETANENPISYEEDYEDFVNSDICAIDFVLDHLSENLLPGDYEENKKLEPKFTVNHLNETIAIIHRLVEYSKNVSEVMKTFMKRVTPRMTDLLLLIDLPPDCLSSLVRIGQSAQEGQIWAMKCELNFFHSFNLI